MYEWCATHPKLTEAAIMGCMLLAWYVIFTIAEKG